MDSILLYSLLNMLSAANMSWIYSWQVVLVGIMMGVPAFVLTPRLVLSLRDLYARDLRGRCGNDIDTAFGLTLSGSAAVTSGIFFADDGQNVDEGQGERWDGKGEQQGGEWDGEIQMVDNTMAIGAGGSV